MGILEKIGEIEKEIARTQKNKGKIHLSVVKYKVTKYDTGCACIIIDMHVYC